MTTTLLAPVAYIVALLGSLTLFSYVYRRRSASKAYEPWFDEPNTAKDMYITLLQYQAQPDSEKPMSSEDIDILLKAALLQRAVEDVRRIWRLREDKPALSALLQKGSVGDEVWNRFISAEKEIEAEVVEVVGEANTFKEGWGQFIFNTASEMAMNYKNREIFAEVGATRTKLIVELANAEREEGNREQTLQIEEAEQAKMLLEKKEKDRLQAEKELIAEEEKQNGSAKKRKNKKK